MMSGPQRKALPFNAAQARTDADAKATSAVVYWKHEAARQRAGKRDAQAESAALRRDMRHFYRAAFALDDANRAMFERLLRLAHGGTHQEFSEWWVKLGDYVGRSE